MGIHYVEQGISREDAVTDFRLIYGEYTVFLHDMLDGFDSASEGAI